MRRSLPRTLLSAALALGLAACSEGDSAGAAAPSERAVAPASQRALTLPSPAELEAQAAEAIDASNADDELARLKAEINGS